VIWSDESSFMQFPTSGRVYVWRTPKEAYNPECLIPTVKHGGSSVMVWAAISWYNILFVALLPFMTELRQECALYYSLFTSDPLFYLWLRHYATSRKVAGSSPDEVEFFILPAALWPWDRLSP
jgi:hypothetical protein